MYLNRAKEIVREDYNKKDSTKENLRQTYNTIDKNMLLLLQDKWVIKGKFE